MDSPLYERLDGIYCAASKTLAAAWRPCGARDWSVQCDERAGVRALLRAGVRALVRTGVRALVRAGVRARATVGVINRTTHYLRRYTSQLVVALR